MTPPDMTDEQIKEIASTPCAIPGSYVHSFAQAIIAARDKQWADMLGEPIGWRNNLNYCVQFRSDEMTPEIVAGYMTPQWTWLYAPKQEKPE
jgi:hypothetical protein